MSYFSTTQRLSDHFILGEFTRSRTAVRFGLCNMPTEDFQLANLRALACNILEPVRSWYMKPLVITSGFRSRALNKHIGGAAYSQHLLGEAADFVIPSVTTRVVAEAIWSSDLPFDQCILETREDNDGRKTQWIHISYVRVACNRRECLEIIMSGGKKQVQTPKIYSPVAAF